MNAPGMQRTTYGPLLFAVMACLFAGSEIYQRADLQLNGAMVSANTTCMQPWNNRCATRYILQGQDGSQQTYVAGPTDHSLPRRLPVGTVLVKDRWVLSYSLNGRKIDDFPILFYSGVLVLGLGCFVWWVVLKSGAAGQRR